MYVCMYIYYVSSIAFRELLKWKQYLEDELNIKLLADFESAFISNIVILIL